MKKLIICLTVSAFALASSLHAGDAKAGDKACCEKTKATSCCAAKSACSKKAASTVLMSPKAAQLAAK